MNIAFIGYGNVGGALANRLQTLGHQITLAVGESKSKSADKLQQKNPDIQAAPTKQALTDADIVFLAVPFPVVDNALEGLQSDLTGKILVDCTNPVGPQLSHGLQSQGSGSEHIAKLLPDTQVVKAFTIYGFENFIEQPTGAPKPVMPVTALLKWTR